MDRPATQLHIPSAYVLAMQHHQCGRLPQAETLYHQILAQEPQHLDAIHSLGVLFCQTGRFDDATNLFRQALTLRPNFPQALANLGHALQMAGRLDEAIAACRQSLALNPQSAEAHNNLGNALKAAGELPPAIAAYRAAIALRPHYALAHSNLGNVLTEAGALDDAIAACRRATAIDPAFAEAYNNLGNALRNNNQLDEAVAAYRRALALNPGYPQCHSNLAIVLTERGEFDDAIAACRRAIALNPNFADAHNNLGNALKDSGDPEAALAAYRQAIALQPGNAQFHSNLGSALATVGRLEDAIVALRDAIALQPASSEIHTNLGNALEAQGRLDDAVAVYQHAIALHPNFPDAHIGLSSVLKSVGRLEEAGAAARRAIELNPALAGAHVNLANALKDQGRLDEAVAAYRQAIALAPDFSDAHNNLLFCLQFCPGADPQSIYEEHRTWAEGYERRQQSRAILGPHLNDRDLHRRLRIGYVSPDFRDHVVARFLLPLFAQHDRAQCALFCYSNVLRPDAVTQQFKTLADGWRDLAGISPTIAAQQVRDDRIDILVDLAGHTAGSRLAVFALKPAPVQVTYLGYPGTTGLRAIDYRITDAHADPPGATESFHSEHLLRLPHAFLCFDPWPDAPPVAPLPALANGRITFGSFNTAAKLNPDILALWARVLHAVPRSHLLLKAHSLADEATRSRILGLLLNAGIAAERVQLAPWVPGCAAHLAAYDRVDIALDTSPYNGTTTTCEALWMGVPVVTLAGAAHVSRVGVSILSNLGLPELIAATPEQYVSIAANLAADPLRLSALRSTLRQTMQTSPLMNAPQFARNVEAAYRAIWEKWCRESETQP